MNPVDQNPEVYRLSMGRKWFGIKMAHDAVQVAKDISRQRLVERLVRKTQDGTLGQPDQGGQQPEDDMGVHVGDIINHHAAPPPQPPQAAPSALSGIAKAAILASVLGTGAAVPLAIDKFVGQVEAEPPAEVKVQPQDDADTIYRLELGE